MNHGVIEKIEVPQGFQAVPLKSEDTQHNYLEYQAPASNARICYEETEWPLDDEDRLHLKNLFNEKLTAEHPSRRLKLGMNPEETEENLEDLAAYSALCHSFVAGGKLVRDGSLVDEERSYWEVRRLGSGANAKTVVAGNLYFHNYGSNLQDNRHAWLVIPVAPGQGGNGYLWLEGKDADIDHFGTAFLQKVIGEGKFKELPPIQAPH